LSSAKLTRLHGLDTLRAVAIVAVMIFHLESFLPSALARIGDLGWMGVDLFFVLSGFLIGSQLLKPFADGQRLRLRDFYIRRAYRILPAYLVVLLLYFAVPAWREHERVAAAWKFLTFTANLVMNYPAELAFSHAWSLCVEEHFYLLLPCLVLWQMRRPAAWKTVSLILSVVLFGVLLRRWELLHVVRAPGVSDDEMWALFMKRIYYPTYCRLDGLVSGVALACIRTFRPVWWAKVSRRGSLLGVAGLLVCAAAMWSFGWEYPTPDRAFGVVYGFPLISLGFGLLVASAASSSGPLQLPLPGAKTLATLAFSLYLTHKEIAHLDQTIFPWLTHESGWRAAGVYAVSCLGFAALLYACVERPFLILRDQQMRSAVARTPSVEARLDPAL
jgi:peptidoglycan/LPS O-acetylase OafA/YrhL